MHVEKCEIDLIPRKFCFWREIFGKVYHLDGYLAVFFLQLLTQSLHFLGEIYHLHEYFCIFLTKNYEHL